MIVLALILLTVACFSTLALYGVFDVTKTSGWTDSIVMVMPDHIFAITVISFILLAILVLITIVEMLKHWDNLAVIRRKTEFIQIVTDARDRIKNHINENMKTEGKVLETMLANGDEPTKQILTELAKAEHEIAKVRFIVEKAHRAILERELGFFWWIVSIWGKE